MQGFNTAENTYLTQKEKHNTVLNERYIKINHYDNKLQFNEAAQKGRIRVVSDASYAYTLNQEVASAAWVMETRSKKERWGGSGLIYAENNTSYGGELYGIYIVLRFIWKM